MDQVGSGGGHPPTCKISLTLEQRGDEHVVNGVTVIGPESRIMVTFTEPRPFPEMLRERPAAAIRRFMSGVDRETGIWSFPGEKVVMKDLILSEPRLVVSSPTPDTRIFVLHFHHFFGQVMGLFDESVTIADTLRMQLDELAFRTIEQALLPLFNISEYISSRNLDADDLPRAEVATMLRELNDRISNLHLHYMVLSQHLEPGRRPPAAPRLSNDLMHLFEPEHAGD